MLHFDDIDIDDHILDKIETKHSVSCDEVLEACASPSRKVRRLRTQVYMVLGQTDGGRHLMVVLARHYPTYWMVKTARDMVRNERRLYERKR